MLITEADLGHWDNTLICPGTVYTESNLLYIAGSLRKVKLYKSGKKGFGGYVMIPTLLTFVDF